MGWTPSNKEGENVISDIYAKVFRHPYVEVAHSYIADWDAMVIAKYFEDDRYLCDINNNDKIGPSAIGDLNMRKGMFIFFLG